MGSFREDRDELERAVQGLKAAIRAEWRAIAYVVLTLEVAILMTGVTGTMLGVEWLSFW